MLGNEDMVIIDGVQYRPEDVPGKGTAKDSSGATVKVGRVTPDDMVIVDGVQYRPEDAPKSKSAATAADAGPGAVTTKVAQPRNKARSAADKRS